MLTPTAILSRAEDAVIDASERVSERAADLATRVVDRVQERVEDLDARAMIDDAIGFVKRRPGVTLVVALTAGFLAGRMLARGRS